MEKRQFIQVHKCHRCFLKIELMSERSLKTDLSFNHAKLIDRTECLL